MNKKCFKFSQKCQVTEHQHASRPLTTRVLDKLPALEVGCSWYDICKTDGSSKNVFKKKPFVL